LKILPIRGESVKTPDVRLVSWDVDGTLYPVGPLRMRLALRLFRETLLGRGAVARVEVAALKRRTQMVERARAGGGVLDAELKAACLDDRMLRIEDRWLGAAIRRIGPEKGAVALLDHLASLDIPSVVISDYTAGYKLDALGLREKFAGIYEGVRIGEVKPSPALFRKAAADFGIPTASLLHIGDRPDTDGAAAQAAGCQVRLFGRDFDSLPELASSFSQGRA
jgi:HAD superfamily hydrolase (TIGR01549 family)